MIVIISSDENEHDGDGDADGDTSTSDMHDAQHILVIMTNYVATRFVANSLQ